MKTYLLTAGLLLTAHFAFAQESFEGIVTYKVEVEITNKDLPYQDYFIQKYGDSLQVFYSKEGNIFRQYHNTGPKGYDFHAYLIKNNHYYGKWKNLDTIYHYDAIDPAIELVEIKKGRSIEILGQKCRSVVMKMYDPRGEQNVIQYMYYSGKPYLDPLLFENLKDMHTNRYHEISKSVPLKMVMDLDGYILRMTALKVEEIPVDPSRFTIPEGIPLKLY